MRLLSCFIILLEILFDIVSFVGLLRVSLQLVSVYKSFFCISYLCLRLFIENRPTRLFRPTVLFRPIIQIVRPYYFVRLYYFLRSSNLPFNVQFSSSYFALFLYLNINLIQIKSRTRTFPETATRSLRPRRTYCNTICGICIRHAESGLAVQL